MQAVDDELVTIGNFEFVSEAEVAQLRLQAEGITAFLRDAQILNMDWLLGNAIGYVKLQVPSEQAEAARKLLALSTQEIESPSGDPDAITCLACGTTLSAFQRQCTKCGWSYAVHE